MKTTVNCSGDRRSSFSEMYSTFILILDHEKEFHHWILDSFSQIRFRVATVIPETPRSISDTFLHQEKRDRQIVLSSPARSLAIRILFPIRY